MSLRIFSTCAVASIAAACSGPESAAPAGESIECAVAGASDFTPVCTLEWNQGSAFTVYHPDGGFRRFKADPEGGYKVTDGAEPVIREPQNIASAISLCVGRDCYLLPLDLLEARG